MYRGTAGSVVVSHLDKPQICEKFHMFSQRRDSSGFPRFLPISKKYASRWIGDFNLSVGVNAQAHGSLQWTE